MPEGLYDIAVVGGGILGSCTALNLARGGMKVVLLEKGGICMQASGRNAGTLTLLYARGPLIPLVNGGKAMWENSVAWLGTEVDHGHAQGLEVAFTRAEADLLDYEMKQRQSWGLPIEIIGGNRARELEPGLSDRVVLAGYSAADGYAASNLIGGRLRHAMVEAGVEVRDGTEVLAITPEQPGFSIRQGDVDIKAGRVLLTANAWVKRMLGWLGHDKLPIKTRVNQVIVTERMAPAIRSVIRVISQISLKQTNNGVFLIGGSSGHPWFDDADTPDGTLLSATILEKLKIAAYTVPALREARIMRTWHGLEGYTPDNMPLVGPVPGVEGAYVMACMRSGWTIGPYAGKLMAEILQGTRPESDLFIEAFSPQRMASLEFDPQAVLA